MKKTEAKISRATVTLKELLIYKNLILLIRAAFSKTDRKTDVCFQLNFVGPDPDVIEKVFVMPTLKSDCKVELVWKYNSSSRHFS